MKIILNFKQDLYHFGKVQSFQKEIHLEKKFSFKYYPAKNFRQVSDSETGPNLSEIKPIHDFSPKHIRFNPKIVLTRIKVKMEKSPVESGICPDETLNPKSARINPKLFREENLFSARIKVKMEKRPVESGICLCKTLNL